MKSLSKNPKMQKYSKYEKRGGGMPKRKKIFRAKKKSPQTLDVRGDPVKLGVKRKRQSFSFRSRNLKIGKYYLVHPETKSVFRFLVTSTKDMGEFTGITPGVSCCSCFQSGQEIRKVSQL